MHRAPCKLKCKALVFGQFSGPPYFSFPVETPRTDRDPESADLKSDVHFSLLGSEGKATCEVWH